MAVFISTMKRFVFHLTRCMAIWIGFVIVLLEIKVHVHQVRNVVMDITESAPITTELAGGSNQRMLLQNALECFNEPLCMQSLDSHTCLRRRHTEDKFECKRFMTFEFHDGRTGNQIFQVSTLIGTAVYHNYTPIISASFPLTNLFDLPNVLNVKLDNVRKFTRTSIRNFDKGTLTLDHSYNWTLVGYMHSWRYFNGAEATIRKSLKLKERFVVQVKDFIRGIVKNNVTIVGVHVRRGDYLDPKHQAKGCVVAPIRYLQEAMDRFRKNYTRVHFFVISNDKKWCQENMKWDDVTLSPFVAFELDFTLLSLCDHVVFTSGTFGWWGAWLSGGEVIYWKGYPRKGSMLYNKTNHYDLYPREWTGLD